MKKIIILLVGLMLFLVACGDEGAEETSAEEEPQETVETEEGTEQEESEESEGASDTFLDNGDYVYEIKEIEQMESQFEDGTQIIAIELTFTNNTEEATSPWMSLGIQAEQETDTTVETLNGANGLYPEDYKTDLVEMGDTDVKPGATVDAVIGYELLYPGEPVKLYDMWEENLFERVVETE
jgi:uncharacterized Zn ribbon protein